jgi:GxxExxY protein
VHSIVGAFFAVYNYYGYGLAESVHVGALELELLGQGHSVVRELLVSVEYHGRHVAWQRLDMVVDQKVIIEAKAGDAIPSFAKRQLLNYLRATIYEVGLLLHFGPEAKFFRFVDSAKHAIRGHSR